MLNRILDRLLQLPHTTLMVLWILAISAQIVIGALAGQVLLVFLVSIIGWFGAFFYIGAFMKTSLRK